MSTHRDWHVGMKVVCIQGIMPQAYGSISLRGQTVGTAPDPHYPEQGAIYTVRHINPIDVDYVLILLEEVRNDHLQSFIRGGLEPGFDAKYFRPVQPRKTSIDVFTAMLTDQRRKVEA